MPSHWAALRRPSLSAAAVRSRLGADTMWHDLQVVRRTASTNADVVDAARDGAAEGLVVVAEEQTAGRGRLDREWLAPPRSALLVSLLLRPAVPATAWPLLPLLAGLAVVEVVVAGGGVPASLKWPNDVMVGEAKLCGILAERAGDAVVVGIGMNVTTRADELPVDSATSLLLEGGSTDREALLAGLLQATQRRYRQWQDSRGAADTVVPAYRERCGTIGRVVTVLSASGDTLRGTVEAVDDEGRLVVYDQAGSRRHVLTVGDVTHVRLGG